MSTIKCSSKWLGCSRHQNRPY